MAAGAESHYAAVGNQGAYSSSSSSTLLRYDARRRRMCAGAYTMPPSCSP